MLTNYSQLENFLSDNDLKVVSHFASTDLDCAYAIYHKKHDFNSDEIDQLLNPIVCRFFFRARKDTEFNPRNTLDNYTMNESKFILFLQKRLKYLASLSKADILTIALKGSYNASVFMRILKRNDEYSNMLYKISSNFTGAAGECATQKLNGRSISEKQMWVIAYFIENKIGDSYRIIKNVEKSINPWKNFKS